MDHQIYSEALLDIIQHIETRTGMSIRKEERGKLMEVLVDRIKHLRLTCPEDYRRLLRDHRSAAMELQKIVNLLSVGESYFFRDQGQFTLLRERILPELIKARQQQRTLKIWSAGCASGEEAYSLAILLLEVLPRPENWQISIMGTDINNEAIAKAKQGVFSSWSFRLCPERMQQNYFTHIKGKWEIKERLHQMVEFYVGNLLELPKVIVDKLQDVDLILCRNVFIYFKKDAVSRSLKVFNHLLRYGGYFLTGHGELHNHGEAVESFRARVHEGSIIYQKIASGNFLPELNQFGNFKPRQTQSKAALTSPKSWSNMAIAKINPTKKVQKNSTVEAAPLGAPTYLKYLFNKGDYATAISLGNCILMQDSKNLEVIQLLAEAYGNSGEHKHAARLAEQLLAIRPQTVASYFLLANLAEAHGNHEEAKRLLKKVIYLNPDLAAAYLELSSLYARENDNKRAGTLRQTALKLLKEMTPEQNVEPYHEISAGDLAKFIEEAGVTIKTEKTISNY